MASPSPTFRRCSVPNTTSPIRRSRTPSVTSTRSGLTSPSGRRRTGRGRYRYRRTHSPNGSSGSSRLTSVGTTSLSDLLADGGETAVALSLNLATRRSLRNLLAGERRTGIDNGGFTGWETTSETVSQTLHAKQRKSTLRLLCKQCLRSCSCVGGSVAERRGGGR